MKKYEKEVLQSRLEDEAQEIKHLKAIYNKAAEDIAKNISITDGKIEVMLQSWDDLSADDKSVYQSKIYQKNFQKQLQQQINDILQELNSGQYKSIDAYLKKCYESGYIGTMYSISKQGIPIIAPIDQKKVIRAMKTNSKISNGLYAKLGEDVDHLKKRIANNISRGIATADSYENIARNIARDSNVGFNKALRISRTEGHRIHSNSSYDAMVVAKENGSEIVKMWDSTMDGKTRSTHRLLDGQIREVEEPFEMGGKKAMYPSGFGRPEEDINCRCALLQRATWALDEDELETLKKRAEYFGLDKTGSLNDFRRKYLSADEKEKAFNNNKSKEIFNKKVIEIGSGMVYNQSPAKEAYNRAVQSGELTPLASFELYQAISKQIDDEIVGLATANGLIVASKSDHFIARTIGSVEQRRNGVAIADIMSALTKPDRVDPVKERENGKTQRFILKGVCAVTINPDTGNLIQVNPLR